MPSSSPIQIALALEAGINILGGSIMLLFPSRILAALTTNTSSNNPSTSTQALLATSTPSASPAAVVLLQWVAVLIYGLTPQLLLALPDGRGAVDKRWICYMTLGAGEGALILIIVWQILMRRDGDGEGAFTRKALLGCAGLLVPTMVWRIYSLATPGWLEGGGGRKRE
ncbi:MAG: hypothetical protein Q9186_006556 [Xanthomendoza sp. 1 TL-2023]